MMRFFSRKTLVPEAPSPSLSAFLQGCSIEVIPRTLARLPEIAGLLAPGTRVYIAHLPETPIADMVGAARRIRDAGHEPMPHVPARAIRDQAELEHWLKRYADEAGATGALVIAGGQPRPVGAFESSIDLMKTGAFARAGFRRLHVAGHPEGSRDIDPAGGEANAMAALRWKQDHARAEGLDMAIVTQFVFDADPVLDWALRLRADGITLPIHVGLAGPAKLQTLLKYAAACGVGPSISVLRKRALDLTQLVAPSTPTELAQAFADRAPPALGITRAHLFPLGGIEASADWLARHSSPAKGR